MFAAFKNEEIIGVIATRNNGSHIALFFVEGKYHKQGVGGQLFEAALKNNLSSRLTVNSSPYGIPVYHKLGFSDTDKEQVLNGIRFTPMEMQIK